MIRNLSEVVLLAALFLGAAYGLQAIGFWSFAGLPEPHGYVSQGLLFLATYFILRQLLFGPYLRVLAERYQETVGKRQEAEKTQLKADEMIASYRKALEESRLKGVRERERLAMAGEEEERQQLVAARQEGDRQYSSTVAQVNKEGASVRESLKASIRPLADEIVERTLKLENHHPPLRRVARQQT